MLWSGTTSWSLSYASAWEVQWGDLPIRIIPRVVMVLNAGAGVLSYGTGASNMAEAVYKYPRASRYLTVQELGLRHRMRKDHIDCGLGDLVPE